MKLLISQPFQETSLRQLREELSIPHHFDAILFPEGYVSIEELIMEACELAKRHSKMIITGYRDDLKKDRALIINADGKVILDRPKTPKNQSLCQPSSVKNGNQTIGYLLCVELLQGLEFLQREGMTFDFIAHPIGVGMYSEEQFTEWINEAQKIAIKYKTIMIGTCHADGSYKNCGVSIPISYCFDAMGIPVYISKNDTRTRIVDLDNMNYQIIEGAING